MDIDLVYIKIFFSQQPVQVDANFFKYDKIRLSLIIKRLAYSMNKKQIKQKDEMEKSAVALEEEKMLDFWQREKIFAKSLEKDAPQGRFTFLTVLRLLPAYLIMVIFWPGR